MMAHIIIAVCRTCMNTINSIATTFTFFNKKVGFTLFTFSQDEYITSGKYQYYIYSRIITLYITSCTNLKTFENTCSFISFINYNLPLLHVIPFHPGLHLHDPSARLHTSIQFVEQI